MAPLLGYTRIASAARWPHFAITNTLKKCIAPKHEQHEPDLRAQEFDRALRRRRLVAELQRERHVAQVDQVEADDEQVVDRSPRAARRSQSC